MKYIIVLCIFAKVLVALSTDQLRANLVNITYDYKNVDNAHFIKFVVNMDEYKREISCSNCINVEELSIKCEYGKVINVSVLLESTIGRYNVPFNISCKNNVNINTVNNMRVVAMDQYLQLSWRVSNDSITKYIIYTMDENNNNHRVITTNNNSYYINIPRERQWYQICMAPIDYEDNTGYYLCYQPGPINSPPLPVHNIHVTTTTNDARIWWDKSQKIHDTHHGYIVNVTYPSGACKSTVINMGSHCVTSRYYCPFPKVIRWSSLTELLIANLRSNTKYVVSVSAINVNGIGRRKIATFYTKYRGVATVTNLRASIRDSYILIQFDSPRDTDTSVMEYMLTINLNRINMCTFRSNTIYDSTINSTSKLVSLSSWTSCCEYLIEVTPLRLCNKVKEAIGPKYSITYRPDLNKPASLINVIGQILSNHLLRISWDNSIENDNCANFGFMVEYVNMGNITDCRTMILMTKTCSELINDLDRRLTCKNKKYLIIRDGVVKTNLHLDGIFIVGVTYGVKMWRITDSIALVYNETVYYSARSECFEDCYSSTYNGISSAIITGQPCMPWEGYQVHPIYGSVRGNLCTQVKANTVPVCAFGMYGNVQTCNVLACPHGSNHIACVTQHGIIQSPNNLTVQWNHTIQTPYPANGYITVLHSKKHTCERYHLQVKVDHINLLTIIPAIQSFYLSCPSGKFSNFLKFETIFESLQPNEVYFVYIIPLNNHQAYGTLTNITVGTTISEYIIPNYITIVNRGKTSIQFIWESFTDSKMSPYVDYYVAKLVTNKTSIILSNKCNEPMTEFHNLDMCTDYCVHIWTIYKSAQSQLNDKLCTRTLSPIPGLVELNDIESGPSTKREVSWKYSGTDECTKSYIVQYKVKYLRDNSSQIITIDGTTVTLVNLRANVLYEVSVKTEIGFYEEYTNVSNYSTKKEFFVGHVTPKITNVTFIIDSSRKNVTVFWSLHNDNKGSLFEYIIRVKDSMDQCSQSIIMSCSLCVEPLSMTHIDATTLSTWQQLSRCNQTNMQSFKYDETIFNVSLISQRILLDNNNTLQIYGMNLMALHKLYEKKII